MNRNVFKPIAAAALLVGIMGAPAAAQTRKVVYFEDFDSVALGPNVQEGILTGSGGPFANVWSAAFPAGWVTSFSHPGIGVLEWQGWNIADPVWWQLACGDQDRSKFGVRNANASFPSMGGYGRGGVAIADPDEWDDFDINGLNPDGDGRRFNGFMTTPAISIAGASANTARLSFFSSWRDESPMVATIEVSFDGGAFTEVLRWTADDVPPGTFHNDFPNEIVNLDINNPGGASTMQVRFGLIDAGNNWWWAVDAITVSAETTAADTNAPAPFFVTADVVQDNTIDLTFSEAVGATSYDVILAKDTAFTNVMGTISVAGSPASVSGVPSGIYYVKVVASNGAGSRDSENAPIVVVDNPCFADWDGNAQADMFDVLGFLRSYDNGCP